MTYWYNSSNGSKNLKYKRVKLLNNKMQTMKWMINRKNNHRLSKHVRSTIDDYDITIAKDNRWVNRKIWLIATIIQTVKVFINLHLILNNVLLVKLKLYV